MRNTFVRARVRLTPKSKPEPTPLVIGQVYRVPLNREGFEVIRSPYGKDPQLTGKSEKNKIVERVFHGKGLTLWRVELRTERGKTYSTEYVRARNERLALKHIEAKFHIVGRNMV